MRRAVEHRAHAQRELLDLVEHGVDFPGQRIDFIIRVANRQALRQIAAHDLRRHRRNRARLRQNAPPHPKAAAQAQQQGHHHRGDQSAHHEALHVLPLLHVVSHQHAIAAGQRETLRAHFVLAGFIAERHRYLEQEPLPLAGIELRPRRHIAGDRAQLRVHHQVHRAAHVLILGALFDQLDEIAARQHQHLFAQPLHLGFDQIVGAAVDHARHGEVDRAQERGRAAGERDRIHDGDAERRGVEYAEKPLIGSHGGAAIRLRASCTPRRAPCAAGACRNPCRSPGAGG